MKLISKFKDYYDYLVHQYGEDTRLILDRRNIVQHEHEIPEPLRCKFYIKQELSYGKKYTDDINKWLVVNGRGYPLIRDWSVPIMHKHPYYIANVEEHLTMQRWLNRNVEYYEIGDQNAMLVELSKKIGRSTFIVSIPSRSSLNGYCHAGIDESVPVLNDLKFSKILPPLEMYLQTVDFVSEHLTEKKELLTVQDNKSKILSHGFDLKQSFRGNYK